MSFRVQEFRSRTLLLTKVRFDYLSTAEVIKSLKLLLGKKMRLPSTFYTLQYQIEFIYVLMLRRDSSKVSSKVSVFLFYLTTLQGHFGAMSLSILRNYLSIFLLFL